MGAWRCSGQLLGASELQEAAQTLQRRLLDAYREPLGPTSGRSYRVLGASWGRSGPAWGGLGANVGSRGGACAHSALPVVVAPLLAPGPVGAAVVVPSAAAAV